MHDPISIREIRSGDLEAVRRINAESSPGVSFLAMDSLVRLTAGATLAWVAAAGQDIAAYLIGFAAEAIYDGEEFAWFKQRRRDFIYVDQIATATSFRGQGIGRMLYSEVEGWAASRSCRAVSCEVNLEPPNPQSLAFHRRCGFIEVGSLKTKDGRWVVLLQKDVRDIG
jgi:uncharacterized protein